MSNIEKAGTLKMSDLPENWKTEFISEIFNIVKDRGTEDSGPYLEIGNVDIKNKIYHLTDKPSVKGCILAKRGDVLVSRVRPTRGAIIQIKEKSLNVSSAFTVLRNQDATLSRYLWLFLSWNAKYLNYLGENCTGTMYPTITNKVVTDYEIPLAPPYAQKQIVKKLDSILPEIQKVQVRLDKIPVLLKRFRQSVLSAACSGRLTADWRERHRNKQTQADIEPVNKPMFDDIPESWIETYVGSIISDLRYGTSKKCSCEKNGLPVLRIPNIVDGTISHSDFKYASFDTVEISKLALQVGDILLIRSNGSVSLVGKTAMVTDTEKGFLFAGYLIRLRPNHELACSQFLHLALSSYELRIQIEIPARSTSGVNNINSEEVKKLQVALPPIEEQREIVRRVEALFKFADDIEAKYAAARAKVDNLLQSILAKAFRGELVPQGWNKTHAS